MSSNIYFYVYNAQFTTNVVYMPNNCIWSSTGFRQHVLCARFKRRFWQLKFSKYKTWIRRPYFIHVYRVLLLYMIYDFIVFVRIFGLFTKPKYLINEGLILSHGIYSPLLRIFQSVACKAGHTFTFIAFYLVIIPIYSLTCYLTPSDPM